MRNATIPAGKHHCKWWWWKRLCWKPKAIYVKVLVNESMLSGSSAHISKICGLSKFSIHKNSVRLGWKNKWGYVEFFEYRYKDGKRSWNYIGSALSGKCFETVLQITYGSPLALVSKPYFGGSQKATKKITIKYDYQVFNSVTAASDFLLRP